MAPRTNITVSGTLRQLRTSALARTPPTKLLHSSRVSPPPLAGCLTTIRAAHFIPRPPPVTPREPSGASTADAPKSESQRPGVPQGRNAAYYQLSFTCVPCGHRSHHNVTKQAYHTGSTLITCPECRNRHIISDHLGIFTDRKGVTIEDIIREKGQLVKRGSLGEDGDIEFWPDGGQETGK